MKKRLLISFPILFFVLALAAQERTEVKVKVIKDGKVTKDTTYVYDDLKKAEHAIKMMDVIASEKIDHDHMKAMKMDMHKKHGGEHKHVMIVTDDGEVHKHEVKDGFVWVTAEEGEDGEKIIIKEGDEKTELIIKEIKEGKEGEHIEIKKEVIVVSNADKGKGEWTVEESEDGTILMISEDGKKIKKIKKKVADGEEEEIEVIVVKKMDCDDEEKMEVEVTIDDSEKEVKEKLGKKKKNR